MPDDQLHRILSVRVDFDLEDDQEYLPIQDRISQLSQVDLLTAMSELFSELIPADALVALDKLEVDLGDVEIGQLETQWVPRVLEALRQELIKYRHRSRPLYPDFGPGIAGQGRQLRDVDLLLIYLRTGGQPWWARRTVAATPSEILPRLLAADATLAEWLFKQIEASAPAVARLSRMLSRMDPELVLRALLGGVQAEIARVRRLWRSGGSGVGDQRQRIRRTLVIEALLRRLGPEVGAPESPRQRVLRALAEAIGRMSPVRRPEIAEEVRRIWGGKHGLAEAESQMLARAAAADPPKNKEFRASAEDAGRTRRPDTRTELIESWRRTVASWQAPTGRPQFGQITAPAEDWTVLFDRTPDELEALVRPYLRIALADARRRRAWGQKAPESQRLRVIRGLVPEMAELRQELVRGLVAAGIPAASPPDPAIDSVRHAMRKIPEVEFRSRLDRIFLEFLAGENGIEASLEIMVRSLLVRLADLLDISLVRLRTYLVAVPALRRWRSYLIPLPVVRRRSRPSEAEAESPRSTPGSKSPDEVPALRDATAVPPEGIRVGGLPEAETPEAHSRLSGPKPKDLPPKSPELLPEADLTADDLTRWLRELFGFLRTGELAPGTTTNDIRQRIQGLREYWPEGLRWGLRSVLEEERAARRLAELWPLRRVPELIHLFVPAALFVSRQVLAEMEELLRGRQESEGPDMEKGRLSRLRTLLAEVVLRELGAGPVSPARPRRFWRRILGELRVRAPRLGRIAEALEGRLDADWLAFPVLFELRAVAVEEEILEEDLPFVTETAGEIRRRVRLWVEDAIGGRLTAERTLVPAEFRRWLRLDPEAIDLVTRLFVAREELPEAVAARLNWAAVQELVRRKQPDWMGDLRRIAIALAWREPELAGTKEADPRRSVAARLWRNWRRASLEERRSPAWWQAFFAEEVRRRGTSVRVFVEHQLRVLLAMGDFFAEPEQLSPLLAALRELREAEATGSLYSPEKKKSGVDPDPPSEPLSAKPGVDPATPRAEQQEAPLSESPSAALSAEEIPESEALRRPEEAGSPAQVTAPASPAEVPPPAESPVDGPLPESEFLTPPTDLPVSVPPAIVPPQEAISPPEIEAPPLSEAEKRGAPEDDPPIGSDPQEPMAESPEVGELQSFPEDAALADPLEREKSPRKIEAAASRIESEASAETKPDPDEEYEAARLREKLRQEPPETPPDFVYAVENAGLVLVWPYLGRFFEIVGLMNDAGFISSFAQERAVFLLQYIASGKTEAEEAELVLNKVLCGVPLTLPIFRTRIRVTAQEEKMTQSMLEAAIGHWTNLGETSVTTFRESFLLREGSLESRAESYKLNVESKAFDLLLQTLPWSISMISLSWMEKVLEVDWKA